MSKEFEKHRKYPVISKSDLEGIFPNKQDYSISAWKDSTMLDKLRLIRDKLTSATSEDAIQCLDGTVLTHIALESYAEKILDSRRFDKDYSFSIALGQSLKYAMSVDAFSQLSPDDKQNFENAVIDNVILVSEDTTLFADGIKKTLSDKGYKNELIEKFTSVLLKHYHTQGSRTLFDKDQELLKMLGDSTIKGLEYTIADPEKAMPGVLICTSNGGGCHKNIANVTKERFKEKNINCAILNETVMTEMDPLSKFIGIPFSHLYPIVFQQYQGDDARKLLMDINTQLNKKFLPQLRFAQFREASRQVKRKINHLVVYSTQHYATDVLAIPEGGVGFFQLCDYGVKNSSLQYLESKVHSIESNSQIKFMVPSESCIPKEHEQIACDIHEELSHRIPLNYVVTHYPCTTLDEGSAKTKFETFTHDNNLYSPDEENVIRISLVMGGQGNEALIFEMLRRIENEIKKRPELKIEVIVGCGRNEQLLESVGNYIEDHFITSRIIPMGYIENSNLIAYNKNAVLITKPGGGTAGEIISNKIQALIKYDPSHSWEEPNLRQIVEEGLGAQLSDDSPILEQIMAENEKRLARAQKREVTIDDVITEIEAEEEPNEKFDLLKTNLRTYQREHLPSGLQKIRNDFCQLEKLYPNGRITNSLKIFLSSQKNQVADVIHEELTQKIKKARKDD